MYEITFKGIRCFHEFTSCPVKPITFLVGENSTGKSTFLAISRIVWDIVQGRGITDDVFNEEPFLLGSYDQIASYRGGKAGRAKSFHIGLKVPFPPKEKTSDLLGDKIEIEANFCSHGAQSFLDSLTFKSGNLGLSLKHSGEAALSHMTFSTPDGTQLLKTRDVPFRYWIGFNMILRELPYMLYTTMKAQKDKNKNVKPIISQTHLKALEQTAMHISRILGPRPYAFAPIRTRPERTYDPIKDVPRPEGSHIPMVLAKTLSEGDQQENTLRDSLDSFGKSSGLFSKVEIKRKGQKESDPFQIGVKIMGPSFNLVDVGYGVSQVLPIIVDTTRYPKNSNFLLQQPEVHLHPKAQAELGSYLAKLAKEQNKKFIIETHSDYLIDRIRMDIRDSVNLRPEDVSILYFDRSQSGIKIYPLSIDDYGDIINAPPSYRKFFLTEERRLFGV